MQQPTEAQRRGWMAQWRAAALALETVRVAEHRDADLATVAAELDEALFASLSADTIAGRSGLVEQQRLFARARR